jgi:tetratricopeptide (TPR) repeat protein
MREASRLEVPLPRLRRLHVRAARAWERRVGDRGRGSARVARHLQAAGPAADPAETAAWCLAAAREARGLYAWDEAFEYADAAVRLLEPGPGDAFARAAMEAASLRLRSGRGFDHVVTLLEAALDGYLGAGDAVGAGHAHSRLGSALVMHHSVMDVPRALEHLEAAERLLPDASATYHLQRGRAQAAMLAVRTDVLREASARTAEIAERAGRWDLAVTAHWARAWAAFNDGRLGEADQLAEEGWRAAHESADPYLAWIAVQAPALRATCHLLDPTTARSWCRRGLGHPRLAGLAHSHSTVVDILGLAMALQGDLASAREVTEGLPGSPVARRYLELLSGRWEDAGAAFADAAEADEAAGDLNDAAVNYRGAAWALRLIGNRAGAVAALDRALAVGVAGPQVPTEVAARAELARLVASEDAEAASRHLERCEEAMEGERWRGLAGTVEVARAALAATAGDPAAVNRAGARATELFAEAQLPWHRADALASWAEHLSVLDAPSAGRRAEAEAAYRALGAADRWTALQATA